MTLEKAVSIIGEENVKSVNCLFEDGYCTKNNSLVGIREIDSMNKEYHPNSKLIMSFEVLSIVPSDDQFIITIDMSNKKKLVTITIDKEGISNE